MGEVLKYDTGKVKWHLMPMKAIELIVRVLMFGEEKYSFEGWKGLIKDRSRVEDALMRHIVAHKDGEVLDPETKLPHLAHAGCNIVFLLWFYLEDQKAEPVVEETALVKIPPYGTDTEFDEYVDWNLFSSSHDAFHGQSRWSEAYQKKERYDYHDQCWLDHASWEHKYRSKKID